MYGNGPDGLGSEAAGTGMNRLCGVSRLYAKYTGIHRQMFHATVAGCLMGRRKTSVARRGKGPRAQRPRENGPS